MGSNRARRALPYQFAYLIKCFEELGYALDKEATEGLITGIPNMYGFLRNTMVLRRKDPFY